MIRQREDRDGLQVQVYAGRDPLTGRKRWISQVEAELLPKSPRASTAAARPRPSPS